MSEEARNIVIALDGSEYSEYAFKWYLDNAKKDNDHVIVVHCPEYHNVTYSQAPVMSDVTMITEMLKEEETKTKKMVEIFGDKLRDNGLGGNVRSIGGKPGEVICRVADEEDATMIVTGTRGMGVVRRTLVGSVSDYILHHAHVPVVVCRHKDVHIHRGTQVLE